MYADKATKSVEMQEHGVNQKACKEMITGDTKENDLKGLLNHGTNDWYQSLVP